MAFGRLESQCLQLLRTERTSLLAHDSWRSLLAAWRSNLQQQQDAAEFLHFLLEHAKPAAYEGEWQGRYTIRNLTFFPTEVIVSSPLHWKFIEMVCRPVFRRGISSITHMHFGRHHSCYV